MDIQHFTKYRIYIIAAFLIALSALTLYTRLLPESSLVTDAGVTLLGNDPWYNLRLVEQTLANFPHYGWFDAMTQFPEGNVNHWGPLFVQITALLPLIGGAATRTDIMYLASLAPPIMAALMVPLIYFIGERMGDWKTGVLASGFIAIVSGQYFYRSLFGFVDHHIGEVLFSTLFCLAFIVSLIYFKNHPVVLKNLAGIEYKGWILIGFTGISYILGLWVMPTMILFALVVAVYTLIQFIIDFYQDRNSEYLLFINIFVFFIAIIGLLLIGIQHEGVGLSRYSFGHVIAYGAVIAATLILAILGKYLKDKPKFFYPLSIIAIAIGGAIIAFVLSPDLFTVLVESFFSFFGGSATTLTVEEARPWSIDAAWRTFQWGLLLMAGGFATLGYKNLKEEHPEQVFVIVWSFIILLSTMLHIRYEYYLAVNVALLSAVFVGFILNIGYRDITTLVVRSPAPEPAPQTAKKKGKGKGKGKEKAKSETKKAASKHSPDYGKLALTAGVLIVSLLFVYTSIDYDIQAGVGAGYSGINDDWREALEWMGQNTPDTGVDYYAIYDRDEFTYPPESYGVMSWWDYGHWITFIAKRIPNANPFQHGVAGEYGAAAFFIQQSEADSSAILDHQGTRYIVTDIEMDTGKFWAMATWYNTTAGQAPYIMNMINPKEDGSSEVVTLYTDAYYQSMISRLHNFDGSMVTPESKVYLIEYKDTSLTGASLPVINGAMQAEPSEAKQLAEEYNNKAQPGYHAAVLSPLIISPVDTVPALRHYRLVHESPSNVLNSQAYDLKYVKIFEYVPGARIKGEGIIELSLQTDTGRKFTYRQESANGEFIVPYSTSGNPYGVKALGKYTIVTTGKVIEVPEEAVQKGLLVN